MIRTVPTLIKLGVTFGLAEMRALRVIPKRWAIPPKSSPFLTLYEMGVAVGGGKGVAVAWGGGRGVPLGVPVKNGVKITFSGPDAGVVGLTIPLD